jgi:hypothetical protein
MPVAVIMTARIKALLKLDLRSPSADTNTHVKVPGNKPKFSPNRMNKAGPAKMQSQPRHCGFPARMSDAVPDEACDVAAIAIPIRARRIPRAVGKKPGPTWARVPLG